MAVDSRGLEVTTTSPEALAVFEEALVDLWNYRLVAGRKLKQALELDPDFAMAQLVRAYMTSMVEVQSVRPKVAAAAERALPGCGTERERHHAAAIAALAAGDIVAACARWEAILVAHPHDLLALKMHHHTMFWTGQSHTMRNTAASVLDAWDKSIPGYSFVIGMMAFSLEECGEYARAEALGRESVELNPDDLWAIHAVAHVLEMQGRLEDGIAWLDRPFTDYADRNPFQGHLWWHLALYYLERGDYETVLAHYDQRLFPEGTDFFLDVQNAASLLKRLELLGVDVGNRWDPVAAVAGTRIDDHTLPYTDLNYFMALTSHGDDALADAMLESFDALADAPHNYAASTMKPLLRPVCEGIRAHDSGDFATAVDRLWPVRNALAPLGGSHAQRDIVNLVLADSALKAQRWDVARAVLGERVTLRPNSRGNWAGYATALRALGDPGAAAVADQRAAAVH